jgi:hypothetical protein
MRLAVLAIEIPAQHTRTDMLSITIHAKYMEPVANRLDSLQNGGDANRLPPAKTSPRRLPE